MIHTVTCTCLYTYILTSMSNTQAVITSRDRMINSHGAPCTQPGGFAQSSAIHTVVLICPVVFWKMRLARLRLWWIFHRYDLQQARSGHIYQSIFWCIGIIHASQKECYFEQNLNFAVQNNIAGLPPGCVLPAPLCVTLPGRAFGLLPLNQGTHFSTTLRTDVTWAKVDKDICCHIRSLGNNGV